MKNSFKRGLSLLAAAKIIILTLLLILTGVGLQKFLRSIDATISIGTEALAADVSVTALVDKNPVAVGESFVLTIQVKSMGQMASAGEPRLPDLQGFRLSNRAQGTSSRLSIQNGKVINEVVRDYRFTLVPESAGKLKIDIAEVVVGGQTYKTKPILIEATRGSVTRPARPQPAPPNTFGAMPDEDGDEFVQQLLRRKGIDPNTGQLMGQPNGGGTARNLPGVDTNEAFFVRVEVDKAQAFIGEQITASWFIYTRNHVRDIDTLKYPDLKSFVKEDIEVATRLNFIDEVVNGVPYKKALLVSYALFPIKEGSVTIDTYKAKCNVIMTQFGMGMGQAMTFTKASPEVKVNILPLPVAGRPKDFVGAVGDFDLKTSLSSTRLETGTPFTFKVRIEGRGNAKMIELPPMDLPNTLETFDNKSDTKFLKSGDSYKEFDVLLIPRQLGPLQLPKLTISYFNPRTKSYIQKEAVSLAAVVAQGKGGDRVQGRPMDSGKTVDSSKKQQTLPAPAISVGFGEIFSVHLPASVWACVFCGICLVLLMKARHELGWGEKKRNLSSLLKKRFGNIRRHIEQEKWRAVGADSLNVMYFALGKFVDESGGGGATMSLTKLMLLAPPSLRRELEGPMKEIVPYFESLSFAPESMLAELRRPEIMKDKVKELERILFRAIEIGVAAETIAPDGAPSQVSSILLPWLIIFGVATSCLVSAPALAKKMPNTTSRKMAATSKAVQKNKSSKVSGRVLAATKKEVRSIGVVTMSSLDLDSKESQFSEPIIWNGNVWTGHPDRPSNQVKDLVALRSSQLKSDFKTCIGMVPATIKKHTDLTAWIVRVELDCLSQALWSVGPDLKKITSRLDQIYSDKEILFRGVSVEVLRNGWKTLALDLADVLLKNPGPELPVFIEGLFRAENWMSAAEKAHLYRLSGEVAYLAQNLEAARAFLERSLAQSETPEARARMTMVDSLIGAPVNPPLISKNGNGTSPNPVPIVENVEEQSREKELTTRLQASIKNGDTVSIMEESVAYLQEYPSGTKSKLASDKIYEAYSQIAEKEDARFQAIKDRVLAILKKVDGVRLAKWAQSAYRSGFYEDALFFAQESLSKTDPMTGPTKTIWFAARGAQATGKWKIAKEHFQKILQQNTGAEEFPDALLQLGLIGMRESEWPTAISYFERVIAHPKDSSQELVARYWLWRALEKTDGSRAKAEAQYLTQRFPLSYYGLRARAELNNGEIVYPFGEAQVRKTRVWMSRSELASWNRVKTLMEAGWWEEAQLEFKDLPESVEPVRRALLARVSASLFDFPRAISQFNKVLEADPTLSQEPFLRMVFPKTYESFVNEEAKIRKLDPALVLSLMRQESAFSPRAQSTSGALGLMQMIPKTAQETATNLKHKNLNLPDDLFDEKTNIRFCTYYLGRVLAEFDGSVPMALAGYNAGPARLKKWMKAHGVTPQLSSNPLGELWFDELPWDETQFYVKAILRNIILYRVLDRGRVQIGEPIWSIAGK